MSDFYYEAHLDAELATQFTTIRLTVLELLALGYSNNNMALECAVGIKAIEHHITQMAVLCEARADLHNLRTRLLAHLYFHDLMTLKSPVGSLDISHFNSKIMDTLKLLVIGLSLKSTAAILGISVKAVEYRIGHLYDFFNVDTDNTINENCRVVLWAAIILRTVIAKPELKKMYCDTSIEKIPRIVENPDLFLLRLRGFDGKIG